MYNQNICLVGFSSEVGEIIKSALKSNHSIKTFDNSSAFLTYLNQHTTKVAVISYPPSNLIGTSLIKVIKDKYPATPVLFIGIEEISEVIEQILSTPLTDFLNMPFSQASLKARVNVFDTQKNNQFVSPAKILTAKGLKLDINAKQVSYCNKNIKMTPTEFTLLQYIVSNKGRVVSQENILSEVWNLPPDNSTKVVQVYVGYIREKLSAVNKDGKKVITTVPGFGYKID